MSSNGHDIQVCLCKSLQLLSNMCVTFVQKHPFWSFSMSCLFLLYMVFPLVFWVLVYSVPLVVCTGMIILTFSFNPNSHNKVDDVQTNDTKNTQTAQAPHESTKGKGNNPFTRVHSVRRRKAKDIARDSDDDNNKNEVFNHEAVTDKNALLTEEDDSPKDIREVEIVQDYSIVNSTKSSSCSASQSPKNEYNDSEYQSLDDINNNINYKATAVHRNEDEDQQKNKMDCAAILDSERTKRLESLMARRRSRKMLSLEVRRTLMNKDKNDHGQIPSFIFPKINHAPSRVVIPRNVAAGSLHSPSPGSAPSIMVPMRNPFDLPYDPQEEKPDLTGDGFAKEFMPPVPNMGRDGMLSRHESFSLGPTFLRPGEYNHRSRKQMSLDSRFRTRASPSFSSSAAFHQFARKEFDRKFAPELKSKRSIGGPDDDDHIKEIIQVHGSEDDGDIDDDDEVGEVQTRTTRENASWCTPTSSEDDDAPVFMIDREAILKSLSSMARRNVPQLDETNEINISNNEQPGEHLGRLKDRFYYSDRPTTRNRATSFSIASDLQVEVSERSSPPLTIDENLSYPDYDDEDIRSNTDSWGNFDLSQVDEYEAGFLVQVPEEDTALSNEPNCAHPWCSIAEFPDSCHTTRASNLDEKIDKTLQRSASSLAQTPKRNDSMKRASGLNTFDAVHENNTKKIEESTTNEPGMSSEERLEPEVITGSSIVDEQTHLGPTQHSEGEQRPAEAIVSVPHGALGSDNNNDAHEAHISNNLHPNVVFDPAQSSPSPKSVLHTTYSVASFDHYTDEETQQFNARALLLSPTPHLGSRAREPEVEEPSEPSNTLTTQAGEQHENGVIPEEVSSINNLTAISQTTNHSNNSNSPTLTKEELSKREEIAIGKKTQDDTNKSNSSLHEEGHEKHDDEESSTSYCFDSTKDEVTRETPIFELSGGPLMEDNVNSESEKNEEDRNVQK